MDVGSDDSGSYARDRLMRERSGLEPRQSSAPNKEATYDFRPDRDQMATPAPPEQGN